MTTEPTQPSVEAGQAPASVPGQAQGHRRRRRRRKTKSSQASQAGAPQPQGSVAPASPQPIAAAPAPQQTFVQSGSSAGFSQPNRPAFQPQNGGQGQGQGQGQGSGRKKKKKSSAGSGGGSSQFQPSPGNSINGSNSNGGMNGNGGQGGGMGKRRKQQRGPRQFVGPMDHSYRIANGNIADGPPSTIPFQGNGHGAYYNDAPARGAVTPTIAEDAHTRIFFFIEDLFFLAKIQEASRKLGIKVEFVKSDKEVLARITDSPENERASLIVFDLNNAAAKPLTVIPKLKAKLKKSTSIIGFLSHLQGDLKMKAVEAGCDTVMPRSAFSQSLPNLLRRYGMDEEEDYYPQPM